MGAKNTRHKRRLVIAVTIGSVLLAGGAAAALTAPDWAGESSTGRFAQKQGTAPAVSDPTVSDPAQKPVEFTTTPTAGSTGINPATPPVVAAKNGTVKSVRLTADDGGTQSVPGTLSADGRTWTATERLAFKAHYRFDITLNDLSGKTTSRTLEFSTVEAANEANAWVIPRDGAVVGTGQPIEINFSEPVTNKDAVEKAITVTSSSGQDGAFYWINDSKARYRPKDFWEPHSAVTVDMKLFGVDFGNGMIGNFDASTGFATHNTRLAVVDNKTKTMKVYIDGKQTKTFPVTLGTEEWPSLFGYQVVMEQYDRTEFRAETIGLKEGEDNYYKPVMVNHASRLTNGGVFVHEALPLAQPVLGKANVSHGCIGMSPEGAKYFYDTFDPGDVVKVLNTGVGPMYIWDGFGDWNLTWDEWNSNFVQPKTD